MSEKRKQQIQMDAHVQACEPCADSAGRVRQMLSAISAQDLVDAPDYVLQRAIAVFPKKKRSLPRLVQAILRFDSWAEPMAAGVRSQDPAPRQLMYQTSEFSVFLMFLPSHQRGAVVIGQIVPIDREADASGYNIQLKERGRILSQEKANDAGEFYLKTRSARPFISSKAVPAKCIDLLIYRANDKILLSNITGNRN